MAQRLDYGLGAPASSSGQASLLARTGEGEDLLLGSMEASSTLDLLFDFTSNFYFILVSF